MQFINEFITIDYTVELPVCCIKYAIFDIHNIVNKASNTLEDKMCHHKSKDKRRSGLLKGAGRGRFQYEFGRGVRLDLIEKVTLSRLEGCEGISAI